MEIHIKKGLDALQTETVFRLLSQTVWACNSNHFYLYLLQGNSKASRASQRSR